MLRAAVRLAMMAAVLGGCAYHGENQTDIDNPVVRKVAWFSYLDGNDIRETCAPGAADRFRLVYNGQYEEQIRSYEIRADGTSDGAATYVARAMGEANILTIEFPDLMAPWRWQSSNTKLSAAEFSEFRSKLAESGWGQGAPQGKRLHSRDFYWVAAGCRDGVFHYDAWVHADGDFADIKFQDFLLARDQTGMAFRQPVKVTPLDRTGRGRPRDRNDIIFGLTVSGEGIGGLMNAF
jgi:hypothetical protein